MFSSNTDALLLSLRPTEAIRLSPRYAPGLDARLRIALKSDAERAMREPIEPLYYGDLTGLYEGGRETYAQHQLKRRELLKALTLGHLAEGGGRYVARIADLMWMICEESCWSAPERFGESRFGVEPVLDECAAETCEVLSSCCHLISDDRLNPVRDFAERMICSRVLDPLIQHGDADIMDSRALECILTAALLTPQPDRSRWLCVRKLVYALDRILDDDFDLSLESQLDAAASLGASLCHLAEASGGEFERRDDPRLRELSRRACALHVDGGWFVNPLGAPRPKLNPDALFALGKHAGDHALTGMASYLHRFAAIPRPGFDAATDPLMRRAMYALAREELERTPSRMPMYPYAHIPGMRTLIRRAHDFCVALCGGANASGTQLRSGDLCIFYRGEMILALTDGAETQQHNLPTIDGLGQEMGSQRFCEDIEMREDNAYALLSMNMARAYPAKAGVAAWQRSVMFLPFEQSVRLIEVFDFEPSARRADFHFHTPQKVALRETDLCVRIGKLELIWEAGLSARLENGESMNRLTLAMDEPTRSGSFTFIFKSMEED